jgi:hypothetical protein
VAGEKTSKRPRGNAERREEQRKGRNERRQGKDRPNYDDYAVVDPTKIEQGSDVIVDVPVVKVDKIEVEADDLRAQVAVMAEVPRLAELSVGAEARLGKVELEIEGVEAQALLNARLDTVHAIVERIALTLDRNPELLSGIGRAVEDTGAGAGELLESTGEVVQDVGEGAEQALPQIGQGANQALSDVGQGAGQGLGQAGQGIGQGLGEAGQGVGQGVGQVGQGAGQGLGDLAGQQGQQGQAPQQGQQGQQPQPAQQGSGQGTQGGG